MKLINDPTVTSMRLILSFQYVPTVAGIFVDVSHWIYTVKVQSTSMGQAGRHVYRRQTAIHPEKQADIYTFKHADSD